MKNRIVALMLILNSASGQVAMKPGDLIIHDIYDSYGLFHIDRNTNEKTRISGQRYDPNGVLLFQNTREIQQHSDGNFYIGNLPYDHIMKVDARFGLSESRNLVALYPNDVFGYSLNHDCHAINNNGICYRIGYKRNENGLWIGGIIAHNLVDGVSSLVSEGNLLSNNISTIDLLPDGRIIVVQDGDTPNVILVDPLTGNQSLVGSSLLLGWVTDLEVLADGRLAIAAAHSGLVIVDYMIAEAPLTGYVANFTSYDPPGGFTYRVKEDLDGNPIVGAQTRSCCNFYTGSKLDLETGEFSHIYDDISIAFEIVKYAVAPSPRLELIPNTTGGINVEFFGQIMDSRTLDDWQLMDPQPTSPFAVFPSGNNDKRFFRLLLQE